MIPFLDFSIYKQSFFNIFFILCESLRGFKGIYQFSDAPTLELHNNFLCFLIAKANGPPGGNASGCVQQVPSLANAPNDEKNLRRLKTKDRKDSE